MFDKIEQNARLLRKNVCFRVIFCPCIVNRSKKPLKEHFSIANKYRKWKIKYTTLAKQSNSNISCLISEYYATHNILCLIVPFGKYNEYFYNFYYECFIYLGASDVMNIFFLLIFYAVLWMWNVEMSKQ